MNKIDVRLTSIEMAVQQLTSKMESILKTVRSNHEEHHTPQKEFDDVRALAFNADVRIERIESFCAGPRCQISLRSIRSFSS